MIVISNRSVVIGGNYSGVGVFADCGDAGVTLFASMLSLLMSASCGPWW